MPEAVIGAKPTDIVHQTKTPEGSLTVSYNTKDILANTVGHMLAVPTTHLMLQTFGSVFRNPSRELATKLHDRFADVPWKGDVLVRVGHTSIFGNLQRYFTNHERIRGRPKFGFGKIDRVLDYFAKVLLLPSFLFTELKAKLFRFDNYNPLTNVVTVFHPRLGAGMHELGHAEFFNQMPRGKREAYAIAKMASSIVEKFPVFGAIPVITSFLEWKATQMAMPHFRNDAERRRESTVLEAAFGGYLMYDFLVLTMPFLLPAIPFAKEMIASASVTLPQAFPELVRELFKFGWMRGTFAGAVAGNVLARLPYPGRRQRFGYIFSGKEKAQTLAPHQVLVATARPR